MVLKTPKTPGLRPCDIAKNGISMVTEKKRHSNFKRKDGEWVERKTPFDKVKVYRRNIPISSELYAEIMEYCFKARISPESVIFDITPRRLVKSCRNWG